MVIRSYFLGASLSEESIQRSKLSIELLLSDTKVVHDMMVHFTDGYSVLVRPLSDVSLESHVDGVSLSVDMLDANVELMMGSFSDVHTHVMPVDIVVVDSLLDEGVVLDVNTVDLGVDGSLDSIIVTHVLAMVDSDHVLDVVVNLMSSLTLLVVERVDLLVVQVLEVFDVSMKLGLIRMDVLLLLSDGESDVVISDSLPVTSSTVLGSDLLVHDGMFVTGHAVDLVVSLSGVVVDGTLLSSLDGVDLISELLESSGEFGLLISVETVEVGEELLVVSGAVSGDMSAYLSNSGVHGGLLSVNESLDLSLSVNQHLLEMLFVSISLAILGIDGLFVPFLDLSLGPVDSISIGFLGSLQHVSESGSLLVSEVLGMFNSLSKLDTPLSHLMVSILESSGVLNKSSDAGLDGSDGASLLLLQVGDLGGESGDDTVPLVDESLVFSLQLLLLSKVVRSNFFLLTGLHISDLLVLLTESDGLSSVDFSDSLL